jgi:hypothetical protein
MHVKFSLAAIPVMTGPRSPISAFAMGVIEIVSKALARTANIFLLLENLFSTRGVYVYFQTRSLKLGGSHIKD